MFAGSAAGVGAIYLFDRGMSKGDDLGVGISGLFAVGTFVFVTVISLLSKLHHTVDWRTPGFAVAFCLAVAALVTWLSSDPSYSGVTFVGWLAILFCCLLALIVSSRFVTPRTSWEEKLWKNN